MAGRLSLTFVLALVASACGASTATPSPTATAAATPTAVAAPPTPSATASAAPTETPTASAPGTDALTGTWATTTTTCAQQDAAVEAAGFTADQQVLAGWDETCDDMRHGSQFTITFDGGVLDIFIDGSHEWGPGEYRIVDGDTFEARDAASAEWYLTYEYAIEGDQLTIDMVEDDFPATSEAELVGERIAQTVIYESATFSRQDYTTTTFVVPMTLALDPLLNPVPIVESSNLLTWDAVASESNKVRFVLPVEVHRPGASTPEPPPADYLAYLMSQTKSGAAFADVSTVTVDGRTATLLTATTSTSLNGSLGCPVAGGDPGSLLDCFGIQPEVSARLAVIELGDGRTLLAWARTSAEAPDQQFVAMFERLLKSVDFK